MYFFNFKKALVFTVVLILTALISVTAFAHSGSLDENGGHYDRQTGEYHYHHGYPAHQHTNGECPYDYDDNTSEYVGGYSSSTESTTKSNTTTERVETTTKKETTTKAEATVPSTNANKKSLTNNNDDYITVLIVIVFFTFWGFIFFKVFIFTDSTKKRLHKRNENTKKRIYYTNLSKAKKNAPLPYITLEVSKQTSASPKKENSLVLISNFIFQIKSYLENYDKVKYELDHMVEKLKDDIDENEISKDFLEQIKPIEKIFPYEYYTLYFYKKDLNEIASVPNEYRFLGEQLCRVNILGKENPAAMILYRTHSGTKFHSERNCHGAIIPLFLDANKLQKINLSDMCMDCYDHNFDDLLENKVVFGKWCDKYKEQYDLKCQYYIYSNTCETPTKLVAVTNNCIFKPNSNRQDELKWIHKNETFFKDTMELKILPYINAKSENVFIVVYTYAESNKRIDIGEISAKRSKAIYNNTYKDVFVEFLEITGADKKFNLGCNIKIIFKW